MRAYDCEAEHIYAVTLSSELSGSYNSALLGRDLIMEDHPDKKSMCLIPVPHPSGKV